MTKVAEGVYCATGPGPVPTGCNSAVIITRDGVVVVDSGHTKEAGRALLAEIRKLTTQPIRYLINTHNHFDHTFGNEEFPPEVIVIGHDYTRAMLRLEPMQDRGFADMQTQLQARIDKLSADDASENDPTRRFALRQQLTRTQSYQAALLRCVNRPPTVSFSKTMTLQVGEREILLTYLGRAHTAGDIVVCLPHERIACTGDLYNGYVGNLSSAYVDEWAEALDRLEALPVDTLIPGHGALLTDRAKISRVRDLLRDLWAQAAELRRQRLTPEAAAPRIDLRAYREDFPQFRNGTIAVGSVARIYELLSERAKTSKP